jgi:hypothetical protein
MVGENECHTFKKNPKADKYHMFRKKILGVKISYIQKNGERGKISLSPEKNLKGGNTYHMSRNNRKGEG